MVLRIDYEFLGRMEGYCKLTAYIPANGGDSGPTISTGFDLGARNEGDLRKLGIKGELFQRFKPYLGLKGAKAQAFIKKNPLRISHNECLHIDGLLKSHFSAQVIHRYNAAIGSNKTRFEDLPPQVQTVVMSVSYQYGDLRASAPLFWAAAVGQNWSQVVSILEDFGDSYKPRRLAEAKLLREVLQ